MSRIPGYGASQQGITDLLTLLARQLPVPLTIIIGREQEIADLERLLA